jgi:hypothetical protein
VKIKLSKPLSVGDKSIEEVDIDLDALTGADIEFCVREAVGAKGEAVIAYEIDTEFHMQVVAKLTGIAREAFSRLPARDYTMVVRPVRTFFLDMA